MKKSDLSELLGYVPGREQRLMILKEVKESGLTIAEIADKYAMPPMFLLNDDLTIQYKGERITPEQFKERFPHRRIVLIGTRERMKEYRESKKQTNN